MPKIAAQRTVMLVSGDKHGSRHTLIGCYYFYEKQAARVSPAIRHCAQKKPFAIKALKLFSSPKVPIGETALYLAV